MSTIPSRQSVPSVLNHDSMVLYTRAGTAIERAPLLIKSLTNDTSELSDDPEAMLALIQSRAKQVESDRRIAENALRCVCVEANDLRLLRNKYSAQLDKLIEARRKAAIQIEREKARKPTKSELARRKDNQSKKLILVQSFGMMVQMGCLTKSLSVYVCQQYDVDTMQSFMTHCQRNLTTVKNLTIDDLRGKTWTTS